MHFTHLTGDIPKGFATEEFVLRPIVASDVELDYDAVMESKEYLRPWEQTGWPADDFTLQDDLKDVVMLEERHNERRAFAYTVMNPDQTECLGCVYLMPPDARSYTEATITPVCDDDWADVKVLVNFWVRTSRLESGLDERLLAALRTWLANDWALGRKLFVTNEQVRQQVALFERAGLRLRFTFDKPSYAGKYLAYE